MARQHSSLARSQPRFKALPTVGRSRMTRKAASGVATTRVCLRVLRMSLSAKAPMNRPIINPPQ